MSFRLKSVLSIRLSDSRWGSDVLLLLFFFFRIINIVFNFYYIFIEFIILLHNFLVIFFAWYKECIICLISFNKFSYVLPAFTCASDIGNLWRICLGVNILRPLPFCWVLKSRNFLNNIEYFFWIFVFKNFFIIKRAS